MYMRQFESTCIAVTVMSAQLGWATQAHTACCTDDAARSNTPLATSLTLALPPSILHA